MRFQHKANLTALCTLTKQICRRQHVKYRTCSNWKPRLIPIPAAKHSSVMGKAVTPRISLTTSCWECPDSFQSTLPKCFPGDVLRQKASSSHEPGSACQAFLPQFWVLIPINWQKFLLLPLQHTLNALLWKWDIFHSLFISDLGGKHPYVELCWVWTPDGLVSAKCHFRVRDGKSQAVSLGVSLRIFE